MSQNYICVRAHVHVKVGMYETGDFCETKLQEGGRRGGAWRGNLVTSRGGKRNRQVEASVCDQRFQPAEIVLPKRQGQNQRKERKDEINTILKRQ